MTYREIVDAVKRHVVGKSFDGVLPSVDVLVERNEVSPGEGMDRYRFSKGNIENFVEFMFDLSLAHTITRVSPSFNTNGMFPLRMVGFEIDIRPSADGSTNITDKTIELFKSVLDPYMLDILSEPPMMNVWNDVVSNFGEVYIPGFDRDAWSWFDDEEE